MSRRGKAGVPQDRGLPLLDAEMWEAPSRLSMEDCLDEIAAGLGGADQREREDEL
ncbi:hypothetical protein [Brevundimonas sp.]|uniref:hypothetical protein n=1 Tax=Brevundimonas sp. TaxID=1871086 RepID=UPI003AF8308D